MKASPVEQHLLKTSLSVAEVVQRLAAELNPSPSSSGRLWPVQPNASFAGKLEGHTFVISKVIRYRNSFLPRISGTIYEDIDGTAIRIKMRLHTPVLIFIALWVTGVTIAGVTTLLSRSISILIPLAMLLFLYLLATAAFKWESGKALRELQSLWNTGPAGPHKIS